MPSARTESAPPITSESNSVTTSAEMPPICIFPEKLKIDRNLVQGIRLIPRRSRYRTATGMMSAEASTCWPIKMNATPRRPSACFDNDDEADDIDGVGGKAGGGAPCVALTRVEDQLEQRVDEQRRDEDAQGPEQENRLWPPDGRHVEEPHDYGRQEPGGGADDEPQTGQENTKGDQQLRGRPPVVGPGVDGEITLAAPITPPSKLVNMAGEGHYQHEYPVPLDSEPVDYEGGEDQVARHPDELACRPPAEASGDAPQARWFLIAFGRGR